MKAKALHSPHRRQKKGPHTETSPDDDDVRVGLFGDFVIVDDFLIADDAAAARVGFMYGLIVRGMAAMWLDWVSCGMRSTGGLRLLVLAARRFEYQSEALVCSTVFARSHRRLGSPSGFTTCHGHTARSRMEWHKER